MATTAALDAILPRTAGHTDDGRLTVGGCALADIAAEFGTPATTARGDILAESVELATPRVGDVVVMPVTGAYCYSLQNNYNGARPPVVPCLDREARPAVRREEMSDLLRRDVL